MYRGRKTEVEEVLKLSSNFLNKYNFFKTSKNSCLKMTIAVGGEESVDKIAVTSYIDSSHMGSVNYIKLNYSIIHESGKEENINYLVKLTSTPCHFGGRRWWFICPLIKNNKVCNRRVAMLHRGNKYFGCRKCFGLIYYSKRMDKRLRFSTLTRISGVEDRIDVLLSQIKKKTYRGKLTKKQLKLENLWDRRENFYSTLTP